MTEQIKLLKEAAIKSANSMEIVWMLGMTAENLKQKKERNMTEEKKIETLKMLKVIERSLAVTCKLLNRNS